MSLQGFGLQKPSIGINSLFRSLCIFIKTSYTGQFRILKFNLTHFFSFKWRKSLYRHLCFRSISIRCSISGLFVWNRKSFFLGFHLKLHPRIIWCLSCLIFLFFYCVFFLLLNYSSDCLTVIFLRRISYMSGDWNWSVRCSTFGPIREREFLLLSTSPQFHKDPCPETKCLQIVSLSPTLCIVGI